MKKHEVYIHRVEWCPAEWYMTESNRELLNSFARVRDHGSDPAPLGDEALDLLRRSQVDAFR